MDSQSEPTATAALPSILQEMLDATMELQGAEFGDVQLYEKATGTLKIVAHRGVNQEFLDHFQTVDASDTSACGLALRAGARIIIEDVNSHPDYEAHRSIAASTGYRGVQSTPLWDRNSGKLIGMLSTLFREPHRPSKRELRLTDLYARQAADVIAFRLAEQRLRESEQHLRLALEAAHMGTWGWDSVKGLLKADAAHQALFGLSPQDRPLPNEVYWAHMVPEDIRMGVEKAKEALRNGTEIQLKQRIVRPDGEVRWILSRGCPKDGDSGCMIGVSYDVTERVRAEQALRESEARLSAILNQVPGGVGLVNQEGKLLLCGGPLSGLWGEVIPSRDPASVRHWRSFDADGGLLPMSQYPAAQALRGETVIPGIDFIDTADNGHETWIRVSATPFRDDAGEICGAVAILQNVDEEKRAEQRLRESEARLRSAVDLLKLGCYSWNPQTNELQWDLTIRAMWGLAADAPVDYDVWRAGVHPEDLPRVEAAIQRCADPQGNGVYDIEYRVIGKTDGVERWIATRGRTQFENDRPVSFYGVALDVTDRKCIEDALETPR